jgi:hypothetical protein
VCVCVCACVCKDEADYDPWPLAAADADQVQPRRCVFASLSLSLALSLSLSLSSAHFMGPPSRRRPLVLHRQGQGAVGVVLPQRSAPARRRGVPAQVIAPAELRPAPQGSG